MGVAEERNHPWTRKHDDPRTPLLGSVSSIVYPKNLHELIEVCESGRSLKAGGLSFSALSDDRFIETNDPLAPKPWRLLARARESVHADSIRTRHRDRCRCALP